MSETNLILGVNGLPPESARNCVQELRPIPNGEFKRTVNGNMVFLESNKDRKYRSVISCKDLNFPIIDEIWVGSRIKIGCIQNLWQSIPQGTTKITLCRKPVDGSVCIINSVGDPIKFTCNNSEIEIDTTYAEKVFVCFRPWMQMQVTDFSIETNEWGMSGTWKIISEEL